MRLQLISVPFPCCKEKKFSTSRTGAIVVQHSIEGIALDTVHVKKHLFGSIGMYTGVWI